MKYKPMPRYTAGALTGAVAKDKIDPVGRMFPQPDVLVGGKRMRLEDAIGPWFAVLCLGGAASTLDRESPVWWRAVGARVVEVQPSSRDSPVGEPAGGRSDDVLVVAVADGALEQWRRTRPGADVVVLRPDRYVAAACRSSGFAATTQDLRTAFGPVG